MRGAVTTSRERSHSSTAKIPYARVGVPVREPSYRVVSRARTALLYQLPTLVEQLSRLVFVMHLFGNVEGRAHTHQGSCRLCHWSGLTLTGPNRLCTHVDISVCVCVCVGDMFVF